MYAFIACSVEQQGQQRSADEAGGTSEQCAANFWGRVGRGHRPLYKVPASDGQCGFGVARESGAVPSRDIPSQATRGAVVGLWSANVCIAFQQFVRIDLAFAPPSRILYAYPVFSLTMNAPLHPEVLRLREESQQEALPLLTKGVQRYVWEGRFGSMLIEVIDGVAHVNGERVECVNSSSADGQATTSSRGA